MTTDSYQIREYSQGEWYVYSDLSGEPAHAVPFVTREQAYAHKQHLDAMDAHGQAHARTGLPCLTDDQSAHWEANARAVGLVCPVCGDVLPEAHRDRRVCHDGTVVCGRATCEEKHNG